MMEIQYKFKALNGSTYTEMFVKNGKTFMNVYDEDGNILDVLEEITSEIPAKEDNSQAKK